MRVRVFVGDRVGESDGVLLLVLLGVEGAVLLAVALGELVVMAAHTVSWSRARADAAVTSPTFTTEKESVWGPASAKTNETGSHDVEPAPPPHVSM